MHEGVAQRFRLFLISGALLAAILICYWAVGDFEFTNWDDHRYITRNPIVLEGLTREGFIWAFSTFEVSNWHPLTWLSHMLDVELFGADEPGAHHLVNVIFHALNSALLLLLLMRMTGSLWRSAIVAALFAIHPLHVESVAWVSERKDVLSTMFGFAAIWFYLGYVQSRPHAAERSIPPSDGSRGAVQGSKDRSVIFYLLMMLCFAASLMCKPMLVTLPFALLLLDYCPLCRFGTTPVRTLLSEKLPLLALSIASCMITIMAQQGAISTIDELPLSARLSNSVMAYTIYIRQMFWPVDLAPLYPLRIDWPLWQVTLSSAVLLAITIVALANCKRWPHLLMGWLFFLGTLAPVIGLVQVGSAAHADRYTYVPLIGLFIALIWSIPDRWAEHRSHRPWLAAASLLIVAALMAKTSLQVRHWRNSITLAQRALDVTDRNAVAHFNLGIAYSERGDFGNAAEQFNRAAQIVPNWAAIHYNLANLLRRTGHLQQAIESYLTALECDPQYIDAYINLGATLAATGKLDEAVDALEAAVKIDDRSPQAHLNLAVALMESNRLEEAAAHFRRTLELDQDNALADLNLGALFGRQGDIQMAAHHFERALRNDPSNIQARVGYATALKDLGQLQLSIQHLRIAAERAKASEQWTLHQQIQDRIHQYQSVSN